MFELLIVSLVIVASGVLSQWLYEKIKSKVAIAEVNSSSKEEKTQKQLLTSGFKLSKPAFLTASFLKQVFGIACLLSIVWIVYGTLVPLETLLKVRASQLIPEKLPPVARFVANIDWETSTVQLDATMSKASSEIQNYIWRIDDGTSLTGQTGFKHTFSNPGYYMIQMSIIDQDDQSDVATCQVLIPPKEVEKIPTSERTDRDDVSVVEYEWSPKGTFYNFSKLDYSDRSYANLLSRYVETGCGYSNRTYNTNSDTYTDFFRDERVQKALLSIAHSAIIVVVVVPCIWIAGIKLITRVVKE